MFRFDGMIVFGTGLSATLRRFLYYDDTNGIFFGTLLMDFLDPRINSELK